MQTRLAPRLTLALGAALGVLATHHVAHADVSTPVSIDVDYAVPLDQQGIDSGAGGQLRFGPRLDLAILSLDAELGLGAHAFSGTDAPTAYRGVVGARLGLGFILRPSVFAHIGVGHMERSIAPDLTHATADVGVALDLTILPIIDLGAHAAYNTIVGNSTVDPFSYAVIGGHITFFFEGRKDD